MTIKFFTGVKTYDYLKEHLKGFNAENKEHTNDIEYREIIDKIINFNCDIEVIGTWVWCFRAFEVKDQLKELGFKWASKKKAWVWHSPEDTARRSNLTLDEIRDLHSSERVKSYSKLYITA